MKLKNLTKYRTELMGFSILWIMLFHSNIYTQDYYLPFKTIKNMGYAGVDIFFLLSGIGIAFSISKNNSTGSFYSKRLSRIIPTFWACLLFFLVKDVVSKDIDIASALSSFIGVDFLLYGELTYWFITSILICYLFTPIYYYLLSKYHNWQVFLAFAASALIISFAIAGTPFSHLLVFTIRIPIFVYGLYLGFILVHKKTNHTLSNIYINSSIFLVSFSALFLIILETSNSFGWSTGLWWYPTIVMAFPLAMIIASLLDKAHTHLPITSKILNIFGIYSLELYLIHMLFFELEKTSPLSKMKWNLFGIPGFFIGIGCSLICSILLKCCLTKINWQFPKNKNQQTTRSRIL